LQKHAILQRNVAQSTQQDEHKPQTLSKSVQNTATPRHRGTVLNRVTDPTD